MAVNLLLNISDEKANNPFKFKLTNIKVYTFEEALYHCYYYWKQSIDDFLSEKFIAWVKEELNLGVLASKIENINKALPLSKRLTMFFKLTDYFEQKEINSLIKEAILWENRNEWEKLKEQGDYLMNSGDYEMAYFYYRKALGYGENIPLINNTAISLMKSNKFIEAVPYFEKAMDMSPDNITIMFHSIECYIFAKEYEKAISLLEKLENIVEERQADIFYFYAEILMAKEKSIEAIECYEKAIVLTDWEEDFYIYRLTDVYLKLRYYDKAVETIEKVKVKDKFFYKKQSDLYIETDNVPAAIKSMEKALIRNNDSVDLWTRLAMYHRMDYDLKRANSAIIKALRLNPDNEKALLESARIKKSMGRIKEYQVVLNGVLKRFKNRYRDANQ